MNDFRNNSSTNLFPLFTNDLFFLRSCNPLGFHMVPSYVNQVGLLKRYNKRHYLIFAHLNLAVMLNRLSYGIAVTAVMFSDSKYCLNVCLLHTL